MVHLLHRPAQRPRHHTRFDRPFRTWYPVPHPQGHRPTTNTQQPTPRLHGHLPGQRRLQRTSTPHLGTRRGTQRWPNPDSQPPYQHLHEHTSGFRTLLHNRPPTIREIPTPRWPPTQRRSHYRPPLQQPNRPQHDPRQPIPHLVPPDHLQKSLFTRRGNPVLQPMAERSSIRPRSRPGPPPESIPTPHTKPPQPHLTTTARTSPHRQFRPLRQLYLHRLPTPLETTP